MKLGLPRGLRALAALLAALATLLAVPQAATAKKRPAALPEQAPGTTAYGNREEVLAFADEVAARHGLDAPQLRATLAAARQLPAVARLIMPAPTGVAKNWAAYRSRFIEPRRIAAGVEFWRANEAWLAKATALYGVPAEIVVGIVGVESIYGRQMGNFRVIDALATLAFDFPSGRSDRSGLFRSELEQFLLMCRSEGLNPLQPRGSYAGALGMPQFLPSSFNRHAVDFDGDSHIDLHTNTADVIGSVAHYLAEFGWQPGLATHYEVSPPADAAALGVLLGPDILPSFTAAEFAAQGAVLGADAADHNGLLALVELQNGDAAPSYVAGTANFYAVTRYNWSSYYALAVIELGAAVKRQAVRPPP
jgi:membrane-bound lytic murein transglycosylase B